LVTLFLVYMKVEENLLTVYEAMDREHFIRKLRMLAAAPYYRPTLDLLAGVTVLDGQIRLTAVHGAPSETVQK
jgi:hypothetical protein